MRFAAVVFDNVPVQRYLAIVLVSLAGMMPADGLKDGFLHPPASARPQTWWHWMNGNVSRPGITADLEAMARVGIGGAQIFDASDSVPAGPVAFASEEWRALVRFAAQEAKRLGLELAIHNCSGWSSSGGPWIAPSNAQKQVVSTETPVKVGSRFRGILPPPPNPYGYYRDIAVIAVKTPAAELRRMEEHGVSVSHHGAADVTFRFADEFPASGLSFACPTAVPRYADYYVTVKADGECVVDARRVCIKVMGDRNRLGIYVPFARRIAARRYDVTFKYKGGALPPKVESLRIESGYRTPDLASKALAIRYDSYPRRNPEAQADQIVARDDVKVLARGEAAAEMVEWNASEGEWTLIRLGYACDGAKNRPGSFAGVGLEADKLDAHAVEAHYREFRRLIPSPEEGLSTLIVDSYEVGCPNWTETFEAEFLNRRGYDIVPHLVALTGRIVGSVPETEKVLADYRRTVADLFNENYGRHFAELCHRDGYLFQLEGYGDCPASELEYGRWADVPMGEFWGHAGHGSQTGNTRYAGFVSHVWGRRFAASESFTTDLRNGRWLKDAFGLKRQGDCVYAAGVNRIVYHRYAHQPWTEPTRYPGMTMGPHGTHFERTLTWWEQSAAWLTYQSRCQWMLQEGVFVADALCYCGEDAPHCGWTYPLEHWHEYATAKPPVPEGYAFDCCALDALEAAKVENGQVVVPGGVRYAVLGLPGDEGLGARSRAAIDRLVAAGAKAVPFRDLPKALMEAGRASDFQSDREDARWIHRRHADGSEAYFVTFANTEEARTVCRFRVTGKVPELWNPETGEVCRAVDWVPEGAMTKVAFEIRPIGSMFIVFRPEGLATAPVCRPRTLRRTEEVKGPWTVSFPAKFAPNPLAKGADETAEFPELVSWTERPERDIRYFSGTATYRKTIVCAVPSAEERLMLDLGEVKNFADVTVNGRRYPTLWKPPFRVDVTDEVKDGRLAVEVKVTNLWVNRLIGDDALPSDCEWDGEGRVGLKDIPAWVRNGEPSPSGRLTFTTWRHWLKSDHPLVSGLLGPVTLSSHSGP